MKSLKFVAPMPPYVVDDVASFDDKIADKIIEKGYAQEIALEDTRLETKKEK